MHSVSSDPGNPVPSGFMRRYGNPQDLDSFAENLVGHTLSNYRPVTSILIGIVATKERADRMSKLKKMGCR